MITNEQHYIMIGVVADDELMEVSGDTRCEVCKRIEKNLVNPGGLCEGLFCEQALDLWLEEEYKGW